MSIVQVKSGTAQIPLGRQGENLARRIQFSLSAWQSEFGPGTPALIHKRNGDRIAYPVELQVEGAAAYWDVTSVDTEAEGYGKCELSYYVDDVIVKSATYKTVVAASMNEEIGYKPQAVPSWVDTVNSAIAKAEAAAQAAMEAAQAALEAARAAAEAAEPYILPIATADQLGGVKIGAGIDAAPDGTVSVTTALIDEAAETESNAEEMLAEVFESQNGSSI